MAIAIIKRNLPEAPEPTKAYHTPEHDSGVPLGRLENDGMGADRGKQKWTEEEKEELIRLRIKKGLSFVACIDKDTDTCADFLREVYGYTATSAQHIAKFERDYGRYDRGCRRRLTWKD